MNKGTKPSDPMDTFTAKEIPPVGGTSVHADDAEQVEANGGKLTPFTSSSSKRALQVRWDKYRKYAADKVAGAIAGEVKVEDLSVEEARAYYVASQAILALRGGRGSPQAAVYVDKALGANEESDLGTPGGVGLTITPEAIREARLLIEAVKSQPVVVEPHVIDN